MSRQHKVAVFLINDFGHFLKTFNDPAVWTSEIEADVARVAKEGSVREVDASFLFKELCWVLFVHGAAVDPC